MASGRMVNGMIVNHVVNWLSPVKERATVVTGETGVFVADTLTGDLTLHRNGRFDMNWDSLATFRGVSEGDSTRFAFPKTEPLKVEVKSFLNAVRSREHECVDLTDGARVAAIIERVIAPSVPS